MQEWFDEYRKYIAETEISKAKELLLKKYQQIKLYISIAGESIEIGLVLQIKKCGYVKLENSTIHLIALFYIIVEAKKSMIGKRNMIWQ